MANVSLGAVYKNHYLPHNSSSDCYYENYSYPPLYYDIYHYCQEGTQNPSIVTLGNGDLGLAYSLYTSNGTLCNATGGTTLTSWTAMDIGWSESTDNGTTWSGTHLIGSASCRWPSSTSPTFATGVNGNVFGAFIMSNETENLTAVSTYVYPPPAQLIAPDWLNLTGDAIGFVSSADNGTTWSAVTAIPHITAAARPQIAVVGDTVYLVYINTINGSGTQPVGQSSGTVLNPQMSVEFIASTNGGSTWTAPVTLPGLNKTYNYTASDPAISVSASGTIAVAYATNQSCVYDCNTSVYPYIYDGPTWGYQVVVSTSSNNGSTWSAPVAVSPTRIASYAYTPYFDDAHEYGYYASWMQMPYLSVGYTTNGTALYVVYSGTYERSSTVIQYYSWEYSGVFASYSGNGGTTWTPSVINAPMNTDSNYDSLYLGAVGVNGGTAYATYVWENDTNCPYGSTCPAFVGGYSQWVATSSNGGNWTSSPAGLSQMDGYYYSEGVWQGWESSVTFTPSGHAVLASVLPGAYTYSYAYPNATTYLYTEREYVNVSIATVYAGPTTYAVVTEHNLSAGANWTMNVDGSLFTTNRTALNISHLPIGLGVLLLVEPYTSSAYRTEWISTLSLPSYYKFTGPTHADANFTKWFGVQFWLEPQVTDDLYITIDFGTNYYYAEVYYTSHGEVAYPSFPWYFPESQKLVFTIYAYPPVSYWNGSGIGSYNGTGTGLNLSLGSPVNETMWAGTFGYYNETFTAAGLPSTSTYSFDFASLPHSAAGNASVTVSDVATGAYTASDITATSNQSGWEYFGWVAGTGRTNLVVIPEQPTATLDFADVNVSAAPAAVEFHAVGLGNGTVWSMSFNGTTYSSSTPYLNITAHQGTYPWSVNSVAVAANDSVGYTPVAVGSTVSVTPGTPVSVDFTPAYRVDVIAGVGGTVSSSGNHWAASGSFANYTAVPSSGYEFGGWFGTGPGSFTGLGTNDTAPVHVLGAITETAAFYPLSNTRFNLTFNESGIPSGVTWTVDLDGVGYSSNTSVLVVNNLLSCAAGVSGQYAVSVPVAFATSGSLGSRYVLNGSVPATLCTTGGTSQSLTFQPEYQVAISATAGGTAYLTDMNVQSNASLWASTNDTVSLTAHPNLGYEFGGWNGTGTGSYTGGDSVTLISVGSPVTEFATFVPVPKQPQPKFTEKFEATPALPAGTAWSVTINGTAYAAVGDLVTVAGLSPAQYTATVSTALSSDGLTKWLPSNAKMTVTVSGNGTQPVLFGKPSYWVEVSSTTGGSVLPASGWQVAGASLTLNATASLGYVFVAWAGSGTGSYSGNVSGATVTVQAPITEVASFAPRAPAATAVSSFWQAPSTWGVLAIVGLLAGLIVGLAVRRLRAAPAAAPAAWTPPASPSEDQGGRP